MRPKLPLSRKLTIWYKGYHTQTHGTHTVFMLTFLFCLILLMCPRCSTRSTRFQQPDVHSNQQTSETKGFRTA